jgi:ribosomal protein L31
VVIAVVKQFFNGSTQNSKVDLVVLVSFLTGERYVVDRQGRVDKFIKSEYG